MGLLGVVTKIEVCVVIVEGLLVLYDEAWPRMPQSPALHKPNFSSNFMDSTIPHENLISAEIRTLHEFHFHLLANGLRCSPAKAPIKVFRIVISHASCRILI